MNNELVWKKKKGLESKQQFRCFMIIKKKILEDVHLWQDQWEENNP
jgi:hypothetical protein